MTSQRIQQELDLLRKAYPELVFVEEGHWVRIPNYRLPQERKWNRLVADVVFQIPASYPGTAPYGFYVSSGLTCDKIQPQSYQDHANNQPPFGGEWGMFSWAPDDGQWKPTSNILTGPNLLNMVRGFADRFGQGA